MQRKARPLSLPKHLWVVLVVLFGIIKVFLDLTDKVSTKCKPTEHSIKHVEGIQADCQEESNEI
jgi:hypothetical protein